MSDQLEELKDKELAKAIQEVESTLKREVQATRVGCLKPIIQSLIASGVFASCLFALALIIRFAAPDSSAGQLLQYLFSPDDYELRIEKISPEDSFE